MQIMMEVSLTPGYDCPSPDYSPLIHSPANESAENLILSTSLSEMTEPLVSGRGCVAEGSECAVTGSSRVNRMTHAMTTAEMTSRAPIAINSRRWGREGPSSTRSWNTRGDGSCQCWIKEQRGVTVSL